MNWGDVACTLPSDFVAQGFCGASSERGDDSLALGTSWLKGFVGFRMEGDNIYLALYFLAQGVCGVLTGRDDDVTSTGDAG